MKRKVMKILFVFFVILMGCEEEEGKNCIKCNETVSYRGIGWIEFGENDVYYLETDCGFEYYEGHEGGYGDTLQLSDCDGGIFLLWAYDSLEIIHLSKGWTGQTDRGFKIGDTLKQFKTLYPEALQDLEEEGQPWIATINIPTYEYLVERTLKAFFDKDNKVYYLIFHAGL